MRESRSPQSPTWKLYACLRVKKNAPRPVWRLAPIRDLHRHFSVMLEVLGEVDRRRATSPQLPLDGIEFVEHLIAQLPEDLFRLGHVLHAYQLSGSSSVVTEL